MAEARKRRKLRWARRLAIALVVGFAVLCIVVAVGGPRIASAIAPAVASRLGLPGRVEVEAVSLSWRGDLSIGRAAIFDPDGAHVASVSVNTAGGLLGLLDGRLDSDIVVDGWATVVIHEDGTTNIERALGLKRGAEADAEDEPRVEAGPLPFARIVFDGLDVALSKFGSPTLAIAGLSGEAQAEGQRINAVAAGAFTMPASNPQARREIEEAAEHGTFDLKAEIGLQDLSGLAQAHIKSLTPELAAALGALSGDDTISQAAAVAARGGLGLELDAKLTSGMPTHALVKLNSETLNANLALETRDGAVLLESPGSVEIDTAAFLADDTIRKRVLPAEGVTVTQAGRLSLNLERLRVPMDGKLPKLDQAEATLRVQAGRTLLSVPGPDGSPVVVRVSSLESSAIVDAGRPLTLTALANAGVRGQPDGQIKIDATVDLSAITNRATDEPMGVALLTRIAPSLSVALENVPTLAAKPWLASLEAMGLNVPQIVGPKVNAKLAWTRGAAEAADVTLDLSTEHVQANAGATWTSEAITLTTPATLNIARPNAIAAAWLPEGWRMENGQGVQASVPELRLPMAGLKPDLTTATASATVKAGGAKVHSPTSPTLSVETLELRLATGGSQTTVDLSAKPTVSGRVATLDASLSSRGLGELLSTSAEQPPAILGTVTLSAPAQLAGAFDMEFAGRPLQQWIVEAIGPTVTARLELTDPESGLLAGTLIADARHTKLAANGISLTREGLSMSGATLTATPSKALWEGLAPVLKLEGSTLASTAPIVVEVGPASLAMGQGADFTANLAAGLAKTSVRLTSRSPITINGVPTGQPDDAGQRPRTDVSLTRLQAGLNSVGRAMSGGPNVQGSLNVVAQVPGQGRIAAVNATVKSGDQGALDAHVVIDELNTQLSTALAGLGSSAVTAIQGALGAQSRIELNASARHTPKSPTPWTLRTASLHVQAPRLTTAAPIEVEFSRDSITLSKPAMLTWTPDAMWLESTIGARVASVKPFEITLDRLAAGNPLAGEFALLDPTLVFIDAALNGQGATIAIKDRPNIELETVTGRVRRVGQGSYSVTSKAATAGGGTLEFNGLIDKPTDAQGRLSPETAEVRGTLKGDDVPVALADALSNTDGLLADSLGDVVDLDAEIQHGKLIPGQPPQADLRFSVRGPRAVASGYGRLADHVISMPESQTLLTVHEVRPEIAQRFSQIIPELLRVEKRPEDGPAVIRTEGLSIPTNGDWAKGQGKMTIALGTARFRTSSVLSSVLKATGQREQGSLGRRVEPINITMVDGVINYQPFELPIGDMTLQSEGTVNLPANSMDVLVWIPMAALTDEAAGTFNTGLGSAIGRAVPGFSSATTVPWRVSGPLDSPNIRPAPRALIERRGDQLFGPLLRPGETLGDLLSLPRRREPAGGGG